LPIYPKLSVFDDRDLRILYLVEPAIVLSQFVSRVFGSDAKYFLEYPHEYNMQLPCDAQALLMADTYLFLHRFGAAYGLSWDKGGEISREYMYKLKTEYLSMLSNPLFQKYSVRPRKYVIHHMSGVNFKTEPNNVTYECTHERVGGADMVMKASMLPSTFVEYNPSMGVTDIPKNGQLKLTIVELKYLTHLLTVGKRFDTIVILGCSPGFHYSILSKCFPGVRIFAIDKRPMCPAHGVEFVPYDEQQDYMFLVPMMGGRRRQVAIISDLYDSVADNMYTLVADYVSAIQAVADVVGVMEKFLIDYKSVMVTTYTEAEYWFQPHVKKAAGEMRRIWYPDVAVKNYISVRELENNLCMHNQYMRPCAKKDGRCWDCHYIFLTAQITQSITGYNIIPFVKKILVGDFPVPPEYRIFERVKTYGQLKNKQKKGFHYKGTRYNYSLNKTKYGVLYTSGRVHIMIPAASIESGFVKTSHSRHDEYTQEKIVWVNDQFLVKVPPYVHDEGKLKTWVYGKVQWFTGNRLGCFVHVVEGDPPAMFLDERGSITSTCGCTWKKTGVAKLSMTYDLGGLNSNDFL